MVTYCIFGLILSLVFWSNNEALGIEIVDVDQRIEAQEEKKEEDDEDVGIFKYLSKYVSLGGVLSGAYQYELVNGPPDTENKGKGAISFQPEISITPSPYDEIFFLLGFAIGNGLNDVTAFNIEPWAAVLEDDVLNINGRGRNYLLEAWYKHSFEFSANHRLGLTGGIIDAASYLDEIRFANNEYTQFMNSTLVNGPNGRFPSFDIGGVLEWDIDNWNVTLIYMNIGENDDGNSFNFLGGQIEYRLDTFLGEGNYRLILDSTDKAFLNETENLANRTAAFLAFDQDLGDTFGAWIRFGVQDDKALVDYTYLFSGGIQMSGNWWGRQQDHIGIGYAYLNGTEQTAESLASSHVAEAYVNLGIHKYLSVTFDVQYMKDNYVINKNDVKGWIFGVRATSEF